MTAMAASAQTLTTLYSFDGGDGEGVNPVGSLVESNGNFYGTTLNGGNSYGGTVFEVTPAGTLTTLYDFCFQAGCATGLYPSALIHGANGNFYGTTELYGANLGGTVFRITPSGKLTVVYSFCAITACADGESPSSLIQAKNGSFYGTTASGGANRSGTVFEVTPAGELTTLYNFCSLSGCADGFNALSGVIEGKDGNFYGTTEFGGITNANCPSGCGTVFKITPSGTLTTLHSFDFTDGMQVQAGLVQGSNGKFYGTANEGGADGYGTVFEITSGGSFTTLHNFQWTDGANPDGALIQGSNGTFYGTTSGGTNSNAGTVFEITPDGELATLYDFCSQSDCTDGDRPVGALVQGTDGNFYGTTILGGTNNDGTIFELLPANPNIVADCNIANSSSGLPPYRGSCGITNQGSGEAYDIRVSSVTISTGSCTYKAPIEDLTAGQSESFPISCTVNAVCNESYTLTIDGTVVGGQFSGSSTFVFCTAGTPVSGTR